MLKISDRREARRFQVRLNARWEGVLAQRTGTIVDISSTGCFLLTSDEVTPKELIRIEIQLPTERWIYLWAEVVYQISEMGFALRFTGSTETEQAMLNLLLDNLDESALA
jgi:PilZ domain